MTRHATLALALIVSSALANARTERDIAAEWCVVHGGEAEQSLPDRTRVDCLTETHAIEFERAPGWAESIGQSLYYALHTGRRAGVVLILDGDAQWNYRLRIGSVVQTYGLPIDVWEIELDAMDTTDWMRDP